VIPGKQNISGVISIGRERVGAHPGAAAGIDVFAESLLADSMFVHQILLERDAVEITRGRIPVGLGS
jgi:hypothetical protein